MKRYICSIIILILRSISFAAIEETYIEIKAKHLKNDFYRVLYDEEKDEIYLGVGSFIDFLRIKELKLDKKNYKISGNVEENSKSFNKSIPKEGSINEEEDIFIPLENAAEIFELKNVEWNIDSFSLNVTPNFKLPYEYLVDAKRQRDLMELDKESEDIQNSEEYYYRPNSFFAPGMMKFIYENSDIKENDYNIGLQYGTQLLYGEFEINQTVIPETKLEFIRLRYPEFINGNSLILGDDFLETDSIYNIDRSIRGISLRRDDYFGIREGNQTVVEGDSPGANLVELYRNGVLIDFLRNTENRFKFVVPSISNSEEYVLRIYRNTEVEIRPVYILGNNRILNKGTSDYLIQIGESLNDKKMQYLSKYSYGVTDGLTLGIGAASLKNSWGDEYDTVEGNFAYRTPFFQYPTIFSAAVIEDIKNDQTNYKTFIEQRWGRNYLFFEYQQYGDKSAEVLGREKYYEFGISRDFNNVYGTIGYRGGKYEEETWHGLYLNFSYVGFRNLVVSSSNEFYRSKDESVMEKDSIISNSLQFNYSGFKGFYTILNGEIIHANNERTDSEISLEVIRNMSSNSYFRNWDFSAEVGYSESKGNFFSLNMAYVFDGLIYIEFPSINADEEGIQVGGRVEKTIYLGDPKLPINNTRVNDGWLKGRVYIDENNNGVYDKGEALMENVGVMVGGNKTTTNKKGEYAIGDIYPGKELYSVEVDKKTIDSMIIPVNEQILFRGSPSAGYNIDIALAPVSIISGVIEAENNLSDSQYNGILAGLEVILIKDEKEITRTQSEMGGYYSFEGVIPGQYKIRLEYNGVRHSPIFDKIEIPIKVKEGKTGDYYEENNFKIIKNAIIQ